MKLSILCSILMLLLFSGSNKLSAQCDDVWYYIESSTRFIQLEDNGSIFFQPGTCGQVITGQADTYYTKDILVIEVQCGNTYRLSTCGFVDFDSYMRLWANDGNLFPLLAQSNDNQSCTIDIFSSEIVWTAPFTGTVWLNVSENQCVISSNQNWNLEAECIQGPGIELSYSCPDSGPFPVGCISEIPQKHPDFFQVATDEDLLIGDLLLHSTCVPVDVIIRDNLLGNTCQGELIRTYTIIEPTTSIILASCDLIWEILDTVGPLMVQFPDDITISCIQDVEVAKLIPSDECQGEFLFYEYEDVIEPGSCEQEFVIYRHWFAYDHCYNSTLEVQKISIVDDEPPNLSFSPSSIFYGLNDGDIYVHDCGENLIFDESDILFKDNCDSGSHECILTEDYKKPGKCEIDGYFLLLHYKWLAIDACANEADISITIAYTDNHPPVFEPLFDKTISCDEPLVFDNPEVNDDCTNLVKLEYEDTIADSPCDDTYWTRIWNATDRCGNASTMSQEVAQLDVIAPEFVKIPDDQTIDCNQDPVFGEVEVKDNCDPDPLIEFEDQIEDGDCINTIFRRNWTVTDLCGNINEVSRAIFQLDTLPPIFTVFPIDMTIGCNDPVVFEMVEAEDNCNLFDVNFVDSSSGICDANGKDTIRTWTATDDCGNTSQVTQVVTLSSSSASLYQYTEKVESPAAFTSFIYPNPFLNGFEIRLLSENADEVDYLIYGLNGQLIKSGHEVINSASRGEMKIFISGENLTRGAYLLKCVNSKNGSLILSEKVVKLE